jgi:class 3 adenylate cyclase/predicted ATPase
VDIAAWLQALRLEQYEQAFRDNAVDARSLPRLTAEDLKELGVTAVGHRRLLLEAIAALGERSKPSATSAPSEHAARAPPERRQLTVMFADLVGSTVLASRLDPEEMREVLRAYQDAVAGEVARYAGHVAKLMGDGVLCYFGWPRAHEDEAERAVRAGLAVVEAVGRLATPDGGTLAARVGIATGLVVVGDLIGAGAAEEEAVVGETPNLAARLQAVAEPGNVVLAPSTRRLAGDLFAYADLGTHVLKGFAEPVRAWRAIGPGRTLSRFEARGAAALMPLVGREEELALLLRRWTLACKGEGQVVLLAGEPGIGKSRLLRALRDSLAAEAHQALRYHCSPYHTNTALHPVIEQLERAAGFGREDAAGARLAKLEALLAKGAADVARAVPLVADLLSVATEGRYPPLELTPPRQKELTFATLLDQLVGLAARRPVLVALEDAHWIDPTTLELFGLVVDRVRNLPALVVITFRPEFAPPWPHQAHVTTLTLTRLSRRQAAALVDRVAGGQPLPAAVREQIVAKTDGVPLFVEELTKAVLEAGLAREDAERRAVVVGSPLALAIPDTLQDSLMARLDRLAPVKEVAQIAACIGREFPYELLAAVAPLRRDQLDHALAELSSAELIFRCGTPPAATYTFKHALVQDAAYQSLLKSRRHQLHARIARVLEERFPETAETQPEMAARHCTEAGLIPKAIGYWHKAGRQAVARSALKEAVAHLSAGLDALNAMPWSAERDRQELELQVTLGAALLAVRGQAAPETGQAFARARQLAEQLGDTPQLLQVLYGLSAHHNTRADLHAGGEAAGMLLRLAQEAGDAAGWANGHRMVGITSLAIGELTTARTHLEAAIEVPGAFDHPDAAWQYAMDPWVTASGWLAWPLLLGGYPEQAWARHQESLVRARAKGHPNTLAQVLYCGCAFHQLRDDSKGVGELAAALGGLATEQAFPFWGAIATIFEGWTLARAGETGLAAERSRTGLAAYRATRAELWQPYFLALAAGVHQGASRTLEALQLLDEALERVTGTRERWYEAELRRLRGELLRRTASADTAEMEVCFRKALDVAQEQGAKWWELRAAASLARLWAKQAERRRAHDLLAPIYSWFTEGFDTPDLRKAKTLLHELG